MFVNIDSFPNLVLWKSDAQYTSMKFEGNVEALCGYSVKDFSEQPDIWKKLIHPDDRDYVRNALKVLEDEDQSDVNVQFRIIRNDNKIRNILGTITKYNEEGERGYAGFYVDVSHKKHEQDMVEHKKNLLNLLGDSISKSFDLEKDRISRVNEVLGQLGEITNADRVYIFDKKAGDNNRPILSQNYEWCREGIESQMSNDVVFDVDLRDLVPRWYTNLVENKSYISGIVRHFPEEEREILAPQDIVSILVTPIWYGDEFFGFIGFDECSEERVWNDEESELLTVFGSLIIASWIFEDSIETVENQLQEVRKLQSEREQFLKMISHQFKTPVSVVRLNTEMLSQMCTKMPESEAPLIEKKIQRIKSSINKFEELIEAILIGKTSNLFEITPESIDVKAWFEELIHTKNNDFEVINEIKLKRGDLISRKVNLPFSKKTLDYIMDTLFSNAIKYRGDNKASIRISYQVCEDHELEVCFRDEGIGIRDEEIPKIATPFYRANDVINISGTGIGLSMVKDSVHAVGGTFEINSEFKKFTEILISIPVEELKHDNQ
ncbi:MAG: ATP-binding protein [Gracilimonas sp.]|nr:ATP-binding protein [Gracilimonas sp.]